VYSWQTAADNYNGVRTLPVSSSDALSALGRGSVSYAAGVDNDKVGHVRRFDPAEPKLSEQLSNLLGLVLIDFAAKSIYGKGPHDMV